MKVFGSSPSLVPGCWTIDTPPEAAAQMGVNKKVSSASTFTAAKPVLCYHHAVGVRMWAIEVLQYSRCKYCAIE